MTYKELINFWEEKAKIADKDLKKDNHIYRSNYWNGYINAIAAILEEAKKEVKMPSKQALRAQTRVHELVYAKEAVYGEKTLEEDAIANIFDEEMRRDIEEKEVEFSELIGKHFLSGVEFGTEPNEGANIIYFVLDGNVYACEENADDGHHSSMRSLRLVNRTPGNIFPDTEVVISERNDCLVFIATENGLTVLEIGTDYSDGYYSSFVSHFEPKNLPCNVKYLIGDKMGRVNDI